MLQKHEKAWSWSYWTRVKVKTGIKGSCSDYRGRSKQKPGHEDLALLFGAQNRLKFILLGNRITEEL